jgi:hypothetical protein
MYTINVFFLSNKFYVDSSLGNEIRSFALRERDTFKVLLKILRKIFA